MISLKEVLQIHNLLIDKYGGSKGVRDINALEAALQRPHATFDNKELYPSAVLKASAIFESIISNHPFIDGNKRTGWVMMRLILLENNMDIVASQKEKYNFVISAASGKLSFDEISEWIDRNKIIK
jgi:death-on-curing protein